MPLHTSGGIRRGIAGICVLLVVVVVVAPGCAQKKERANPTSDRAFGDFKNSLDQLDDRLDASRQATRRVQSTHTFDLQRAYMDFMAEYFNVSADTSDVLARAEAARDAVEEDFVLAEKRIEQRAAKKGGGGQSAADQGEAERLHLVQVEARREYDVLQQKLGAFADAYRPYRDRLGRLYKYLYPRLTRERVAAATPLFEAADAQVPLLQAAVDEVRRQADVVEEAARPAAKIGK